MVQVNITEQMVDAQPQEIITNDNLNARVDAQVYFRVQEDEQSVKSSQYHVNNYQSQIVNLARTTLRNIIGTLTLKSANSEKRQDQRCAAYHVEQGNDELGIGDRADGVERNRSPKDVQETMNKVVKAGKNEKVAALDFANAAERQPTVSRGRKSRRPKGFKQAKILAAEGEAEAIRLVNEARHTYFVGNAQLLRKLEALENSLSRNAKIVILQVPNS